MYARSDLMRRDVPEVTATSHPDKLRLAGNELPLEYVFEPGSARDGITVTLPLPLLATATPADFATPIPGWRVEKITELLRSLAEADPQGLRPGARARRARGGGDRRRPQGFPCRDGGVDHALRRRRR